MSEERKLATIQTVGAINPIPEADKIEVLDILGWHVVSQKNTFKVGDNCVYVEIDSILPAKSEFEFLKDAGYRIKTRKFRRQVSQGIAFPLSILPEHDVPNRGYVVGDDVTDILGISKWEPQSTHLAGQAKGNFPSFIPKTDETRIQSIPHILEKYRGTECYISSKLDGTSLTVYLKDGSFGVCSRRMDLKDTEDSTYWNAVRKLDLENKLRALGKNIAMQGELVGPGIQKNKYALKEYQIRWFNVYDIDKREYACYNDFVNFIESLGCETVPLLGTITLNHTVDDLVELAKGKSALNGIEREGIVIRPVKEIYDDKLGRLSFKVINSLFLLKWDE